MKTASQTRRNLGYSTIDGLFATPWTVVSFPGSFLMAGLLNVFFQIGPFWFGLVVAMPALANATNILMIPIAARFMKVRDMTLCFSCINVGLWLSGIIAIAFLPVDHPQTAGLFFTIFYGLTALTLSLTGVAWTAWVGDFIPTNIRGRYMGERNRYTNISTLSFMAVSLLLLKYLDASRTAYLILGSLAALGRLISVFIQFRIESPDPTGGAVTSTHWAKEIGGLRHEPSLLRFIAFGAASGFGVGFLGALYPLYALDQLGASPAEFTGYSIAATLAGTACVRLWGKLIDRHGAAPVLLICFIAWKLGDFGWVLVSPETRIFMFPIWAWGGAMVTGYLLASFNLILKLIPKQSRSAGISLNLTTTSITATAAPVLAGSLIKWAGTHSYDIPLTYRAAIFIGICGSLASTVLLLGLKEPKTNPTLNTVQGALRTLRTLAVSRGLAFLGNANFVARRKRPDPNP